MQCGQTTRGAQMSGKIAKPAQAIAHKTTNYSASRTVQKKVSSQWLQAAPVNDTHDERLQAGRAISRPLDVTGGDERQQAV